MVRCQFVQALGQRPGQQVVQVAGNIQIGEMTEARDLAQVRHQPVLQAGEQGAVADVGPFAGVAGVQLAQQHHTGLPLAQFRRPGQQLQAFAPNQVDQRLAASVFVEAAEGFAAEHQFADFALALGAQHAFALVPIQLVDGAYLFGEDRVEQRRIKSAAR